MTSREKNELKQEGAIQAAQNQNSAVSSEDAQKVVVDETKKAGHEAFQFDPNASPEEKAAQARAVSDLHSRTHVKFADLIIAACTGRLPS